jgi:uncharacterized protein (DUF111 family)
MPVPAPATLELLKGAPMIPTEIRGEMITPTGAGIVGRAGQRFRCAARHDGAESGRRCRQERLARPPETCCASLSGNELKARSRLDKGRNPSHRSRSNNQYSHRGTSGRERGLAVANHVALETNVDDMNPELWDFVFERLFAAGAADVWLQPVQMKKNRPASLLGALCETPNKKQSWRRCYRETTNAGRASFDRAPRRSAA